MNARLKKLEEQRAELLSRLNAIVALADEEDRDYTDEETAEIDDIQDHQLVELDAKLVRERKIVKSAADQIRKWLPDQPQPTDTSSIVVPAKAKSRGKLKAFTDERDAYVSGQFLAAAVFGNTVSRDWLNDHGLSIRNAHSTGDNTKGGYLVPDVLESAIIRMVEQYGVFRANARVYPMSSDVVIFPRRASGFTTYFLGDNDSITTSDLTFDQVQLMARKLGVLTQVSSELSEDSVVALADLMATEMAYAFANKEDDCGFNGTGTSTYGGIVGLAGALAAGSIVTTASNVDTFAEIVIGTFEEAVGAIQQVPGLDPKWYCHQSCWANVMARLAMAGGGNTVENFSGGVSKSFLGYPVVTTQVLQSGVGTTDISGNIFAYFGDLGMTATLGDRRGISVKSDESVYFTSDAVAVRATERFDINVHERGTASAAGTMVALKANAA